MDYPAQQFRYRQRRRPAAAATRGSAVGVRNGGLGVLAAAKYMATGTAGLSEGRPVSRNLVPVI